MAFRIRKVGVISVEVSYLCEQVLLENVSTARIQESVAPSLA
jgi:hypothetical protein